MMVGGERPARAAESGGAMRFPKQKLVRFPGRHAMIEPCDRENNKRNPWMIDVIDCKIVEIKGRC
jgi:hypothetical protein